jgi:transposase InsO family protein
MAWELKKVDDQRKELMEAYFEGSVTMKNLCKRFGISRKTAYKWVKRFTLLGMEGLKDLSKAPHLPHRLFGEEEINLAVTLKLQHRTWGPKKIHHKLKQHCPQRQVPSATRLYEIFKEHHLVNSRKLRSRVPATHPLETVNESNDTWMADFKGWFLTQNNEKCEPFTLTDGFSRYLIKCIHLEHKSIEAVWDIIKEAFHEYGLPTRFRTDNGPPFGSTGVGRLTRLSINLIKAGVMPEWIHPGHPEENGRHERMHLTLQQDVADPPAETLQQQKRKMQRFQREYNFERPHEALCMQTPASVYRVSTRTWDGKLREPEYSSESTLVRKVGGNGCIRLGKDYFISQTLSGEHIGLREVEQGFQVYYGPIYLGRLVLGQCLEKPKIEGKNSYYARNKSGLCPVPRQGLLALCKPGGG